MHRVSVLSPRPSTGTSLHTCTLRRKGKTSFFPVTLCASSSCIIFLCATHTYTHTLMHTHILTSSPPSEIRRERRWEDVQRRLFPLYSPFPSLTHVHLHAHTLSLSRAHTHILLLGSHCGSLALVVSQNHPICLTYAFQVKNSKKVTQKCHVNCKMIMPQMHVPICCLFKPWYCSVRNETGSKRCRTWSSVLN